MIPFQHGFDIESRTTTKDGHRSPTPNLLIDIIEILLVFEEVVLRARLTNINQVIRNGAIVLQVFARTDIHATIYLTGVGGDNLPAYLCRQTGCHRRLA
jgi:hypothetical protein